MGDFAPLRPVGRLQASDYAFEQKIMKARSQQCAFRWRGSLGTMRRLNV